MFKKMLAILSGISAMVLTGATVVSCGPMTFEQLMQKTVDTDTLYWWLEAPVTSWSPGKTNQSRDSYQLSQVYDNLLQRDEHDNIIGDIADGWEVVDAVADTDKDKIWKVHIRDDVNNMPQWFTSSGDKIPRDGKDYYQIKAYQVANTLRYVFNPGSISLTAGIWTQIIQGAVELSEEIDALNEKYKKENSGDPNFDLMKKYIEADQIISKYIKGDLPNTESWGKVGTSARANYEAERAKFQREHPERIMIEIDNEKNIVTYNMQNPTSFFPSVLTYVAFTPLPDEAIDWLGTYPGKIHALNYGKTYDLALNSGPYNVNKLNSSTLTFKANPNYRQKEDVHIHNIVLNRVTKVTGSTRREKWQSGDFSYAPIMANDVLGWNLYIGDKWQEGKTNFEGAHFEDGLSLTAWNLMFNFAYVENAKDEKPQDNDINKAMAQKSTRALIAYAFDRQVITKFYSNTIDNGKKQSALSINNFTPKGLITFEEPLRDTNSDTGIEGINPTVTDYQNLVADNYLINVVNEADKALGTNFNGVEEAKKVEIGNDIYLHNDYMAYMSLTDTTLKDEFKAAINDQTDPNKSLDKKIQILIKQVMKDYKKYNLPYNASNSESKVKFTWLNAQTTIASTYPFILEATRRFNIIPNNPIEIIPKVSASNGEFTKDYNEGKFSIGINGWSPDYDDPSSYLNTVQYGGDYDTVQRITKVVDANTVVKEENGEKKTTIEYKGKNTAFDGLATDVGEYTKALAAASKTLNFERYNSYAKQEATAFYKNYIVLPLYTDFLSSLPYVSYVDTFSKTKTAVGTSKWKYIRQKMIPKLWTKAEFEAAKKAYEDNTDAAKKKSIDDNWFNKQKVQNR